jgi:isopentenyl-diphosphate delta-isomerase
LGQEKVILVNENDEEIGYMEKMEAHVKGLLHRAFSVFVFNDDGEMLIHQRAKHKYHSGGLWTNACCSHPRKGETNEEAAHRRLMEEMGFDCEIEKAFEFTYKAELDKGLSEHEYDHVFLGRYNGKPNINPEEVENYKWIDQQSLLQSVNNNPGSYTEWFKIAVEMVYNHLAKMKI